MLTEFVRIHGSTLSQISRPADLMRHFGGSDREIPVAMRSKRGPIPIVAGARLTGQAGGYSIGALSIGTEKDQAVAVTRDDHGVHGREIGREGKASI